MPGREEFDYLLRRIENELLKMGYLVHQNLLQSFEGFFSKNAKLIKEAMDKEDLVDRMENTLNQQISSAIALYQPVGVDLRRLLSFLFIANDHERIADLSHNASKIGLELIDMPPIKPYVDLPRMSQTCSNMLEEVLSALIDTNAQKAQSTAKQDDIVDSLNRKIWKELLSYMMEDPQCIEIAEKIIVISKQLERIGDHITNIAERICYMDSGLIPDLNE
jgi:phosphate transport system protein